MAQHNELGQWGEDIAKEYLRSKGYTILHTNWTFQHYEIDIIACKDELLLFVEVKTRSTAAYGQPYIAVDRRKSSKLLKAANAYLRYYQIEEDWRFDIIAIVGNQSSYTLEHIENGVDPIAVRYR